GDCVRAMWAKSAETAPPRCTPRNSRGSASKRIFSPRQTAPASKPSFSSTTPASVPSFGAATIASRCVPKSFSAIGSSTLGRFTSTAALQKSLPAVHRRFGCRLTAATLGTDGVLAWDGAQFHYAPAFQVDAIDTTGAGDLFHAGFIYALLQGWPLQKQLDFACAAAALNCTAVGARGGIAPLGAIERLMSSGFRYASVFALHAAR